MFSNAFKAVQANFASSIVVFLVALPLCLGIAQASGAPVFSGVVAGIIGGVLVGALSKSALSVSGPAAGLTAIVFAAVLQLQSYELFLCAVLIAGLIQLLLGILKAGFIADYIPTSVIEGMLAAIGITIILKQLPEAFGFHKQKWSELLDAEDGISFSFLNEAFHHIHYGVLLITLLGLAIIFFWQSSYAKKINKLPSGLVVVLVAVSGVLIYKYFYPHLELEQAHFVQIPIAKSLSEFGSHFLFPNLKGFTMPEVWIIGIEIAIVASIETLLSIEAIDKLDPHKNVTPTDVELRAQGIGNIANGLLGGMPITSVIVRSSANMNAGAKSKASAILHGVLLLICVVSIPHYLNWIPKAALAAILIATGYKLCNPSKFKQVLKVGGWSQFVPFMVTIIAVVATDLLKGVCMGLLVSIFYILKRNMHAPFYFQRSVYSTTQIIKIELAQVVSFLNKASIKEALDVLPAHTYLVLDASQNEYIDYDVIELIREFQEVKAQERHIQIAMIGFNNRYKLQQTITESELLSTLAYLDELPKRFAGNHQKLIQQLKQKME
jgi:MFS superfamily sulfate permease-like transporter